MVHKCTIDRLCPVEWSNRVFAPRFGEWCLCSWWHWPLCSKSPAQGELSWSQPAKRYTTRTVIHHVGRTLQLIFKTPRWARRAWHCGTKAPECWRGVGGTFGRIQSTAIYAAVFHFGKWKGSPMFSMFRKTLDSGYCIEFCKNLSFHCQVMQHAAWLVFQISNRRTVDIQELPTRRLKRWCFESLDTCHCRADVQQCRTRRFPTFGGGKGSHAGETYARWNPKGNVIAF